MTIANETAQLTEVTSNALGGTIALNGMVDTRTAPTFSMDLSITAAYVDQISESFELLQGLAPIAKALEGKLSTRIAVQGPLNSNLTPILNQLGGKAAATLNAKDINPEQTPLLTTLREELSFMDLSSVDLSDLSTNVSFANGQVQIQPFDFTFKEVVVTVHGGHSFNNDLNYTLSFDLPATKLGADVSGLLSKLSAQEKENLHVTIPVLLSGTLTQPQVQVNTQAAITDLSSSIIAIQKQRVKDKAKDKLDTILGDLLGSSSQEKDGTSATKEVDSSATSTKIPQTSASTVKEVASGILGGLLKKKTKKKDSVPH